MAEARARDQRSSLAGGRLAELLDTGFEFSVRPAPVPADVRAHWRIPLLLLIVDSCRSRRASLQQLQAIAWAAIFEESRDGFLRAFNGESNPAALLIRYDPAITRAADLAVGLDILAWERGNRLAPTATGEEVLAEVLGNADVMADERAFLSELGSSIPMSRIDKMLCP